MKAHTQRSPCSRSERDRGRNKSQLSCIPGQNLDTEYITSFSDKDMIKFNEDWEEKKCWTFVCFRGFVSQLFPSSPYKSCSCLIPARSIPVDSWSVHSYNNPWECAVCPVYRVAYMGYLPWTPKDVPLSARMASPVVNAEWGVRDRKLRVTNTKNKTICRSNTFSNMSYSTLYSSTGKVSSVSWVFSLST